MYVHLTTVILKHLRKETALFTVFAFTSKMRFVVSYSSPMKTRHFTVHSVHEPFNPPLASTITVNPVSSNIRILKPPMKNIAGYRMFFEGDGGRDPFFKDEGRRMVRGMSDVQNSHNVNNMHSYSVVPVDRNKDIPLYPLPLPTFDNKHHVLGVRIANHSETRYGFLAIHRCIRYLHECRIRHRSMESHWRQGAHRARDRWYNRIRMTWVDR